MEEEEDSSRQVRCSTYLEEEGAHTWRRRWRAKWGKAGAAVDGGLHPSLATGPIDGKEAVLLTF